MTSSKFQILFAEDEDEIALLVTTVLRRAGHAVDRAADGDIAMSKLKENPGKYQLVITDSNMPGVSGLDVIRYLRSTDFQGKIVLLSGNVSGDSDDEYRPLRIDRIMPKPFALNDFTAAIEELRAGAANGT